MADINKIRRRLTQALDARDARARAREEELQSQLTEEQRRIAELDKARQTTVTSLDIRNLRQRKDPDDGSVEAGSGPPLPEQPRETERNDAMTGNESEGKIPSAQEIYDHAGHKCSEAEAFTLALVVPQLFWDFLLLQDKVTSEEMQIRLRQADETVRILHDLSEEGKIENGLFWIDMLQNGKMPWRQVNEKVLEWSIDFPWLFDVYFDGDNNPVFPGNEFTLTSCRKVNRFYKLEMRDYNVTQIPSGFEAFNRGGNQVTVSNDGELITKLTTGDGSRTFMPFGVPLAAKVALKNVNHRISVIQAKERDMRKQDAGDENFDTRMDYTEQSGLDHSMIQEGEAGLQNAQTRAIELDSFFGGEGTRFTEEDQALLDQLSEELAEVRRHSGSLMTTPRRDEKQFFFYVTDDSYSEVFKSDEGFITRDGQIVHDTVWNKEGREVKCIGGVSVSIQDRDQLNNGKVMDAASVIDKSNDEFEKHAQSIEDRRAEIESRMWELKAKKAETERKKAEEAAIAVREAEAARVAQEQEDEDRQLAERIRKGETDRLKQLDDSGLTDGRTKVLVDIENIKFKELGDSDPDAPSSPKTVVLPPAGENSDRQELEVNETEVEGRAQQMAEVFRANPDGSKDEGQPPFEVGPEDLLHRVRGSDNEIVWKSPISFDEKEGFLDEADSPIGALYLKEGHNPDQKNTWRRVLWLFSEDLGSKPNIELDVELPSSDDSSLEKSSGDHEAFKAAQESMEAQSSDDEDESDASAEDESLTESDSEGMLKGIVIARDSDDSTDGEPEDEDERSYSYRDFEDPNAPAEGYEDDDEDDAVFKSSAGLAMGTEEVSEDDPNLASRDEVNSDDGLLKDPIIEVSEVPAEDSDSDDDEDDAPAEDSDSDDDEDDAPAEDSDSNDDEDDATAEDPDSNDDEDDATAEDPDSNDDGNNATAEDPEERAIRDMARLREDLDRARGQTADADRRSSSPIDKVWEKFQTAIATVTGYADEPELFPRYQLTDMHGGRLRDDRLYHDGESWETAEEHGRDGDRVPTAMIQATDGTKRYFVLQKPEPEDTTHPAVAWIKQNRLFTGIASVLLLVVLVMIGSVFSGPPSDASGSVAEGTKADETEGDSPTADTPTPAPRDEEVALRTWDGSSQEAQAARERIAGRKHYHVLRDEDVLRVSDLDLPEGVETDEEIIQYVRQNIIDLSERVEVNQDSESLRVRWQYQINFVDGPLSRKRLAYQETNFSNDDSVTAEQGYQPVAPTLEIFTDPSTNERTFRINLGGTKHPDATARPAVYYTHPTTSPLSGGERVQP